jgi:uncharacterized tellurite resistance protein B-like protein
MHIILGILGLLGAAAFWWFRMRDVGRAAGEVVDAAQTIKGAYNRKKFLGKAEGSAITAIDDVPTAALTILTSIALARGLLSPAGRELLQNAAGEIMKLPNVQEALTFSNWAAEQSPDPNNVLVKLAPLLMRSLTTEQKRQFLSMADEIASVDGAPDLVQKDALRRLHDRIRID